MPKEAALALAKEKGLDLIEIAPTAKPPVARIMSYDKFRYQKEKEFRKQRQAQRGSELKQIRISARAQKNDLALKARKVEEFLGDGHVVEVMLVLRGREKYNRGWADQKLREFLQMIAVEYKMKSEPRFGGKGLVMQLIKKAT